MTLETQVDSYESLPSTETEVEPSSIALVMIGHYPDWGKDTASTATIRGNQTLETIKQASEKGHQVVIALTEQTNSEFKKALPQGITIVQREQPGRRAGSALSLETARQLKGIKSFIYTQPEKTALVSFLPKIASLMENENVDFVVPRREENTAESTYPDYMWKLEKNSNKIANKLLHNYKLLPPETDLDLFFGVIAFPNDPEIIDILLNAYEFNTEGRKGEVRYSKDLIGLGNSIIYIVELLSKGHQVATVDIPFAYPSDQKQDEIKKKIQFIEKRRKQRHALLNQLVHYLRLKGHGQRTSRLSVVQS